MALTQVIPLTKRQRDVVELAREGYSYAEIGARLGISSQTVRIHIRDVAWKFGGGEARPLRYVLAHLNRILAA